MQQESLGVMLSPSNVEGRRHHQRSVEAEIGSGRDRGLSVPQDASSFRECDNLFSPRYGNWCKEARRHGHRSEPCAGDSERRRQSLVRFRVSSPPRAIISGQSMIHRNRVFPAKKQCQVYCRLQNCTYPVCAAYSPHRPVAARERYRWRRT